MGPGGGGGVKKECVIYVDVYAYMVCINEQSSFSEASGDAGPLPEVVVRQGRRLFLAAH